MKRLLLIASCVLIAASAAVNASLVSSNLYSPQSISANTNSGTPVAMGTVILPSTTYTIQNLGLSQTNTLAVDISVGFATNAMTVVGTYVPSVTNATIDSFILTNSSQVQIYMKATVRVMTNSATVGVQALQQR